MKYGTDVLGTFTGVHRLKEDVLVAKLVHGDGCVLGVGVADVGVAIVLWDEVHVVEEEAVPVFLLHGLPEAHVHQLGSVKRVVSSLGRT